MDDDMLLGLLRDAAAEHDPVPESTRRVARGALLLAELDVELAAILEDSVVDDEARAGVRSVGMPRLVVFGAGDLEIEVEVFDGLDGRRIVGQLAPACMADVRVRTPWGAGELVQADELGRFSAALPAGPISLRIERVGCAPVATSWLAL